MVGDDHMTDQSENKARRVLQLEVEAEAILLVETEGSLSFPLWTQVISYK